MTRLQKVLLVLLIIFVLIQFVRPERNIENNPSRYDIFHKTDQPTEISAMVQAACYDCHSNRTAYPWYASVAPVSWFLANHVKEGKEHMNFSEWKLLDKTQQLHMLDEIKEVLEKQEMPPKSYQWLHDEARLSAADHDKIINWVKQLETSLN
ncbi:MAG: heme-binding domain-containing protein [Bacteroidetes bacterium]|nr:heme-binding domain-containing protein [Bacteroidota bacterium]MBU1581046.1 heme-binding domain-containing protein [Bacteroidota bacterium]MBU2465896.1 heme-binding domain-containing protein [Bacteroidota bacterium]MBU2558313.1 heme-binding domain-containing protein [Bacteroidota bacterium]